MQNNSNRDNKGRFIPGNQAAVGRRQNHAERAAELREAALAEVTGDDLRRIIRKLVELAAAGNVPAAREVLDRTLGQPIRAVDVSLTASEPDHTFAERPTDEDLRRWREEHTPPTQ